MESYLIRHANLEQAVRDWNWKISEHEEKVQEALEQAVLPYASYRAADSVRQGDIVTAELHSSMPRFNRTCKLNVGSGMFDPELEKSMVGRKAGKEFSCAITKGEVLCRISEISRLEVPEVTDEIARAQEIPGVSTAEDLKKYYRREACREELHWQIRDFMNDFCEKCEFFISKEDIHVMDENELEFCRGVSRGMGKVFDEMRGDEMMGAVGCHDIDEFREMIHAMHIGNLKKALVASAYTGEEFTLASEQVYGQIQKLEEKIFCQLWKGEMYDHLRK